MSWPPTSLTAEQMKNAQIIVDVGRRLGASDRDVKVALMAAMQESELTNMVGGDRDSTGMFQQRNAWGSYSDRMDPYKSAAMFFQGGQDGQRGLLDFHTRDQMSLTQAAQAVQVSAYPDAYAKWSSLADTAMGSAGGAPSGTSENAVPAASTHTITSANTASPQAAYTPPAPGAAVLTAPGAEAVTTAPGAESAVAHMEAPLAQPSTPDDTGILDQASFHNLFPDASQTKAFSGAANGANSQARRGDVVSTAMSYLGTPYAWGGNGRSGLDCSGLVQQVYQSFGVDVPRLSADQIRAGRRVSYDQLRPGDLLGWDTGSRNNGADHISIYAGNNQIIEAPRPGLAVRRRTLSQHEIATGLGTHFPQLG